MDIEFLKPMLGDELYAQVVEKLADAENLRLVNAADGSYVPREKMEQLTQSNRQYKAQIAELNTKLTEMQSSAAGAEELRQQLADAQRNLAAREAEMQRQSLSYRVKDLVREAKAKNADLVLRSIDMSKISEDNGNILGLADQLEALKKSDSYLFENAAAPAGGVDPQQAPDGAPVSANSYINSIIRESAGYRG